MRYSNVCIESLGYTLPSEIWTSDDVEDRLLPLYQRLKLPQGRLELMTGIRERRFWPAGTRPSQFSCHSCRLALAAANLDPQQVGCLIHGSVCRDFLEPATACVVHYQLGLRNDCVIYDTSNACLGILNGMVQAANMIELGQIKAALVVGSESGRQLVEATIAELNNNESLTRKTVKPAFASLTIGSASCAVLLTHREISNSGTSLVGGAATANTRFHDLCQSQQDQAGSQMQPLMDTDSEELMRRGIETGQENFSGLLAESRWTAAEIQKTVCHQVGVTHRKLMLESLGLDPANDFTTFEFLGNTGAAALPVTLAMGVERGAISPGEHVGLLGIGSGINCVMLAARWQKTAVRGAVWDGQLESNSTLSGPHGAGHRAGDAVRK
jgi:3-oxoacyl-[acyl-carrier-protein] synthase-3